MNEPIVILIEINNEIYPTLINTQYIKPKDEIIEIAKFLDNTICRANEYKEKNGYYPEDIEDLKGWEEIKI